ncbi:MAG: OstA-like protein [Bacteroidota bacterium]|nr:OstA-like protein [Bacteroidota bacterium]
MKCKEVILFFLLMFFYLAGFGQKQIDYSSKVGYVRPEKPEDMTLVNNVVFVHDSMTMYCDSAIYNKKENYFFAFNNIVMLQNDTRLTGDELHYYGNERVGHLTGKAVILEDDEVTMQTDYLLLDRNDNTISYMTGADIWDEKNTLKSKDGIYFIDDKVFNFYTSVVLTSPDALIYTDTLFYNTKTDESFFEGATKMILLEDSTIILTNSGMYNTKTEEVYSTARPIILTKDQHIEGDTIYYDSQNKKGYSYGNIFVQDTANDMIVLCDSVTLNTVDTLSVAILTGQVLCKQIDEEDTLYFHADTVRIEMDTNYKVYDMYGFPYCKFFRQDIQGASQWCHYRVEDSVFTMLYSPMIWTENAQLSADTIVMETDSKGVKKMYMFPNPLIVQNSDTLSNKFFNQIIGRYLTGWFEKNSIKYAEIEGNTEIVYYLWEEKRERNTDTLQTNTLPNKEDSSFVKQRKIKELTGVNIGKARQLNLFFAKGEIKKMTAVDNPAFYIDDDDKLPLETKRLKGFIWKIEDKPLQPMDIFIKREL